MPGSLTGGGGENVPGNPGACATHNFTYVVRGPLICVYVAQLLRVRRSANSLAQQWRLALTIWALACLTSFRLGCCWASSSTLRHVILVCAALTCTDRHATTARDSAGRPRTPCSPFRWKQHNDSTWVLRRLKLPTTRLFVRHLDQHNSYANISAQYYWRFVIQKALP